VAARRPVKAGLVKDLLRSAARAHGRNQDRRQDQRNGDRTKATHAIREEQEHASSLSPSAWIANCKFLLAVRSKPFIGVAGWTIRQEHAGLFLSHGTHLQRYASVFGAVEINSSFYKPHRRATYEKWSASVPGSFRFAVKMPKLLTHERALEAPGADLPRFLEEVGGLGAKLGCLLIQLPPRLAYDPRTVEAFFHMLRRHHAGQVVLEPRHSSWFTTAANDRLDAHRVARVIADPPCDPSGDEAGGWPGISYFRLHGSPVMYHSSYDDGYLERLAIRLSKTAGAEAVWCIFDNTARGAATVNALSISAHLPVLAGRGAKK